MPNWRATRQSCVPGQRRQFSLRDRDEHFRSIRIKIAQPASRGDRFVQRFDPPQRLVDRAAGSWSMFPPSAGRLRRPYLRLRRPISTDGAAPAIDRPPADRASAGPRWAITTRVYVQHVFDRTCNHGQQQRAKVIVAQQDAGRVVVAVIAASLAQAWSNGIAWHPLLRMPQYLVEVSSDWSLRTI